jgi:hypothetical protein
MSAPVEVPLESLGATISAHVAKGDASMEKAEQHYKSAGIHLIEAKERVKQTPGLTWPAFLNAYCKIRRARADELIMIADGRTTLADLRMKKAESVRATRERKKDDLPLRSGDPGPGALSAPAFDVEAMRVRYWRLIASIDDETRESFFAEMTVGAEALDPIAELETLRAENARLVNERDEALAEVERLKVEVLRLKGEKAAAQREAAAHFYQSAATTPPAPSTFHVDPLKGRLVKAPPAPAHQYGPITKVVVADNDVPPPHITRGWAKYST